MDNIGKCPNSMGKICFFVAYVPEPTGPHANHPACLRGQNVQCSVLKFKCPILPTWQVQKYTISFDEFCSYKPLLKRRYWRYSISRFIYRIFRHSSNCERDNAQKKPFVLVIKVVNTIANQVSDAIQYIYLSTQCLQVIKITEGFIKA